MSSPKTVTYDCLSIKITTATFAQPRSYFVTAQCIHKDSNIDDTINESIPKYRTAASKTTKTPSFNTKKPIVIKLPTETELSEVLESHKIVFEAYAVVVADDNDNKSSVKNSVKGQREAKLMGDSVIILKDKKDKLLTDQEIIEDVITLEGMLKVEDQEKRVPVGQASITLELIQITESIPSTKTNPSSASSMRSNLDRNPSKSSLNEVNKSMSMRRQSHIYTIKTPPKIQYPGIQHANSIMIQINRWWGDNIDLWPESFVHVMHRTCGEVVTATHPKSGLSVSMFIFVLNSDFDGF